MLNKSLVDIFGGEGQFSSVMEALSDEVDSFDNVKTFFAKYRNPIGIEVEMENYTVDYECQLLPNSVSGKTSIEKNKLKFWDRAKDGSLKVRGVEFISHPLSGKQIDYAIYELAQHLIEHKQEPLWSVRTSTHVHLNMSTLKHAQLIALVSYFVLFEEVFFSMVEPRRRGNPYCYPVSDIDPSQFMEVDENNKYCGLNLAPLKTFGTVEFRHLQGTDDWRLVRRWCQMIVKLHAFVESQRSRTILADLNQSILQRRSWWEIFVAIFGASASLFNRGLVENSAEQNLLWVTTFLKDR